MNIISISKKKFEELKPLVLSKEIFNSEWNIYEFDYRGKRKIAKKLFHQNGPVFANKLDTLKNEQVYRAREIVYKKVKG